MTAPTALPDASPEVNRLRWRCRRGMRELDQLLLRYVDRCWAAASDTERSVFLRLLDCEDDTLWRWCMGLAAPEDKELDELVGRILDLPAPDSSARGQA